jgi:hypothetical protein
MDEPTPPVRHLDVEALDPASAAVIEEALREQQPLAIRRGGEAIAEVRAVEPERKRRTLAEIAAAMDDRGLSPDEMRAWHDDIQRARHGTGRTHDPWADESGT